MILFYSKNLKSYFMEKKTTGFEYESLAIFQQRCIVKKPLRNRIVL